MSLEAFLSRLANFQEETGDLPELQQITRLQRSVTLEKMTALEDGVYGIMPY